MLERDTAIESVATKKKRKNHFLKERKHSIDQNSDFQTIGGTPETSKQKKLITDEEKRLKHERTINYLKERRDEKDKTDFDPLHPKFAKKELSKFDNEDDIIAVLKRRAQQLEERSKQKEMISRHVEE